MRTAIKAFLTRPWTPRLLPGLSGWWRQGDWVSSGERASQWNDSSGNARNLLQATGANQPIVLPWSGTNYLWTGSGAGGGVTVPDKTITGNLTFNIDLQMLSYSRASDSRLLSKTAGNNGFALWWLTTGQPFLQITDGSASTLYFSRTSPGWSSNTRHTLKVVWQDGVGATFFFDGVQDGAVVAGARTLSNSSVSLGIVSANMADTKVYSASITNGAGTTYYSVDFTQVPEGTTSFVQNGDTYTVNATGAKQAQIVGSPQMVGDGAAYFMRAAYTQAQPVTRFFLMRPNTWAANANLLNGVGETSDQFTIKQAGSSPIIVQKSGGASGVNGGNLALGAYHAVAAGFSSPANGLLQIDTVSQATGNPGSNTSGGMTLFADAVATAAGFSGAQAKEILEFSRALSQGEINQCLRYLSKLGNLNLAL